MSDCEGEIVYVGAGREYSPLVPVFPQQYRAPVKPKEETMTKEEKYKQLNEFLGAVFRKRKSPEATASSSDKLFGNGKTKSGNPKLDTEVKNDSWPTPRRDISGATAAKSNNLVGDVQSSGDCKTLERQNKYLTTPTIRNREEPAVPWQDTHNNGGSILPSNRVLEFDNTSPLAPLSFPPFNPSPVAPINPSPAVSFNPSPVVPRCPAPLEICNATASSFRDSFQDSHSSFSRLDSTSATLLNTQPPLLTQSLKRKRLRPTKKRKRPLRKRRRRATKKRKKPVVVARAAAILRGEIVEDDENDEFIDAETEKLPTKMKRSDSPFPIDDLIPSPPRKKVKRVVNDLGSPWAVDLATLDPISPPKARSAQMRQTCLPFGDAKDNLQKASHSASTPLPDSVKRSPCSKTNHGDEQVTQLHPVPQVPKLSLHENKPELSPSIVMPRVFGRLPTPIPNKGQSLTKPVLRFGRKANQSAKISPGPAIAISMAAPSQESLESLPEEGRSAIVFGSCRKKKKVKTVDWLENLKAEVRSPISTPPAKVAGRRSGWSNSSKKNSRRKGRTLPESMMAERAVHLLKKYQSRAENGLLDIGNSVFCKVFRKEKNWNSDHTSVVVLRTLQPQLSVLSAHPTAQDIECCVLLLRKREVDRNSVSVNDLIQIQAPLQILVPESASSPPVYMGISWTRAASGTCQLPPDLDGFWKTSWDKPSNTKIKLEKKDTPLLNEIFLHPGFSFKAKSLRAWRRDDGLELLIAAAKNLFLIKLVGECKSLTPRNIGHQLEFNNCSISGRIRSLSKLRRALHSLAAVAGDAKTEFFPSRLSCNAEDVKVIETPHPSFSTVKVLSLKELLESCTSENGYFRRSFSAHLLHQEVITSCSSRTFLFCSDRSTPTSCIPLLVDPAFSQKQICTTGKIIIADCLCSKAAKFGLRLTLDRFTSIWHIKDVPPGIRLEGEIAVESFDELPLLKVLASPEEAQLVWNLQKVSGRVIPLDDGTVEVWKSTGGDGWHLHNNCDEVDVLSPGILAITKRSATKKLREAFPIHPTF